MRTKGNQEGESLTTDCTDLHRWETETQTFNRSRTERTEGREPYVAERWGQKNGTRILTTDFTDGHGWERMGMKNLNREIRGLRESGIGFSVVRVFRGLNSQAQYSICVHLSNLWLNSLGCGSPLRVICS